MTKILILLFIYQLKHFLADYPMQTPYMLGKFKDKDWILPLSAHCGVHALFTFIIAFGFTLSIPIAVELAAFDFVVHFIMDRIKANPKMLGRFTVLSRSDFMRIQYDFNKYKQDCDVNIENRQRIKENTYFWWSLGLDQMVHHVTHYIIIFIIVG